MNEVRRAQIPLAPSTPHEPLSDELGVKLFVFGSAAAFLGIAGLVVVIVVKFLL